LTLDEAGRELYQKITKAEPYSRSQAMNKTPYDHGMERGRGEGIVQGIVQGKENAMRNAATALLESKYRSVPQRFLERIDTLGYDELLALVVRIPNAASMESLFPSS